MFERYTEQARRALFFARYEASQLGGASIRADHLLLGMLRDGVPGFAGRMIQRSGLSYDSVRAELAQAASEQPKLATSAEMPLAVDCKAALERAAREADLLKHPHIGTEHVFLALLHEAGTLAGGVLARAGLRLEDARSKMGLEMEPRIGTTHVVLVQVRVNPELQLEFEEALLHNARESVRFDPGCLRFDVSQDKDDPTRWVLYEVYDSPEAHATHRRSPHFLAYDAVAARAVVEKTVAKCAGRHVT